MSKHTQGPWYCQQFKGAFHYVGNSAYGNPKGDRIAETIRNPKDARLIAAAPDLLEALKMALEASTQSVDDFSWEDAAIAAINKAEGNQ